MGPGATVSVLGMGVPRLACLRPTAWLKEWPSMAHLHRHKLKTLPRRQASWDGRQEASSGTTSSGWLARRRRGQGGAPHEVPVMQAMTTESRRVPACAESLFPLWCKGGKRRREYQATTTISVQQDQDQQDGRTEVIVEPNPASSSGSFGKRGSTLVRISVLDVPLQNGQLLAPFPLNIWEEARGLRL